MPTENGYSNQKKKGTAQFKTVHDLGSNRFGTSVTTKSLFDISAIPAAIVSVSPVLDNSGQVALYNIELTAHGISAYNLGVLKITSGVLAGWEIPVEKVVDVDNIQVLNIFDTPPAALDLAKPMGWVTSKADSDGNVNFSPGPAQFVQDAVSVVVTEDTTTPANNRAMPSQLMIYKDGVQYPVTKDTADIAQTVAVPVEIVGLDGTTINITAGDINVQLTDQGVNADVTRIGDGTNQLGITAANEAKVHDADALVELEAINLKTPALVAGKVPVDTGLTQGLTDTQLRATPVPVSGTITTGGLTDAELRATPVAVSGPLTDTQLRASALPVSGPLTDTQLRAAAVDVASLQLPASLGQKTAPNSLSVVLATGSSISATITGGATEAKQDAEIVELDAIKDAIGSVGDAAEVNPADPATLIAATKGTNSLLSTIYIDLEAHLAKLAGAAFFDDETQDGIDHTTPVTFTMPVGATKMVISNNASATAANRIRFCAGANTPSWSTPRGQILGVGSFTSEIPAGDFKVIAEDASSTAEVSVSWF